jgi:2-iminobutanoate/2-iminopropanoate deaminase
MMPEPIVSPEMPRALGPYSQAVRVAETIYVAGQAGLDPTTGTVAEGGFNGQARQAFLNLAHVLRVSGSGMDRVAKTTVFMADAADFPALNALFAEFFPTRPPVRSTPIVSLPRGLLISIEAIAVVA